MSYSTCQSCLYPASHPLGLEIDDEGICSGCRIHEEKDTLNWDERWKELEKLVEPYRRPKHDNYDCIVPVSGANDSYFIVHTVKNKLGLNPLLVTYNKYFNTPLGIRNLANLRIQFDCDILFQNVNPQVVKKVTRTTLQGMGSVYWAPIAGQTVFPVQTAVRYGIPLIIWGAHQGLEQVGMFSHLHNVEMTRRYRADHDLIGREGDALVTPFNNLHLKDTVQYEYPSDAQLNEHSVRGIYLGNYVRWDPKAQHEQMIAEYGYETASFERTFDCYDYVDCYTYMGVHDLLKLYKHGYSKVTDHACREIRFGRMTREEGMALVKAHELNNDPHLKLFAEWIGAGEKALQFVLDQYRNNQFWDLSRTRQWEFRGISTMADNAEQALQPPTNAESVFVSNSSFARDRDNKYITIGKGWP